MVSEIPAVFDLHKHEDYEPYALSLGKLIHSWNHLHGALGYLLWMILSVQDGSVPLAIWNSATSDHAQRQMLKAATSASRNTGRFKSLPRAADDIEWLIQEVEKIRHGRNDAIHAPLGVTKTRDGEDSFIITPWDAFGSLRAKSLVGKDLLKEFDWYRAKSDVLSSHSILMGACLAFPKRHPWPNRPLLPTLGTSETSG